MSKSELENTLAFYLRVNSMAPPVTEHRFHPKRKWRFDMAWPEIKLAVEIEGGIHMAKSGHNTPAGITRDIEKGNEAALLGWTVIRVTGEHIENGAAIDWIRRALAEQGAERAPF